MKAVTRITFYNEQGEKFFGEGPARLMRGVEREGSLLQSARSMEMAYSKAVRLIRNAEEALGFRLLFRTAGGASGGGSTLTEEGRAWLMRYEAYRDACTSANETLYRKYYGPFSSGCVIMASGLGKRFGGNKLMADLSGTPVIQYCLNATEGLFSARTAVTRNRETAAYTEGLGIDTVFHELPGRNDTVRLGLRKIMEADADGCLFAQADQPLLQAGTVRKMLTEAEKTPEMILRASADGKAGAPVWFPEALFPELLTLPEGKGGGVLIKKYPDRVRSVETEDPWELFDIDTREDLRKAEEILKARAAEEPLK